MKLTKIAFGVALAAGSMAVQADSIFFPYVVTSDSVTTIVNVIDTKSNPWNYYNVSGSTGTATDMRLHYTLLYKVGNDALDPTKGCGEYDIHLPHSPYDVQTIDLGGKISDENDKGIMFNDPSVANNWRAKIQSTTMSYAMTVHAGGGQGVRGYLLVDDASAGTLANPDLTGEAMVYDFNSGAAWGYDALRKDGEDNSVPTAEWDYSNNPALAPTSVGTAAQFSFMPPSEVVTRFFVTPVNYNNTRGMHPTTSNNGDYESMLTVAASGTAVAYDRDEGAVSGAIPKKVVCVGALELSHMMTSGAAAHLNQGGWTKAHISSPNAYPKTSKAVVYKLEFNTGSTFNGRGASGIFNSARLLAKY